MAKFHMTEPGTDPMQLHAAQKSDRVGKVKLILAISGLLLLCVLGPISLYLMTRPNPAQAEGVTITPLASETIAPSVTTTETPTATGTILPSKTPTMTRTATLEPSQTPWMITQVVTVVKQLPGSNTTTIEKHFVEVTRIVPYLITATPEPSQTPWIITVIAPVEVTRIVEVTPTFTPEPTETAENPGDPYPAP
jgi:hypothetical protein